MKYFNTPALIASTLILSSCQSEQQENSPQLIASDAKIVLSPVSGRPAAAYFTLKAQGKNAVLTGVNIVGAEQVMLHETVTEDGVTKMNSAKTFPIKSGQELVLEPGGKHAMIFGLNDAKPNQQLAMTLQFDDGETLTIDAATENFGSAAGAE